MCSFRSGGKNSNLAKQKNAFTACGLWKASYQNVCDIGFQATKEAQYE